jgi:hypothetical protein
MATQAPQFTAWLDNFFASYYRHRPVNATFIGRHEYDDRLPDFSEQGVSDVVTDMRALLARMAALPPEPLTPAERLDRTLAIGFLETQLWEYGARHFQAGNPSTYTGEAIFGVIALFLRPFAPLSLRLPPAIARLHAVPRLLAQGEANIREAPPAWTARAIQECQGALAFLDGGVDILIAEHGMHTPELREAANSAAAAFRAFQAYLERDLSQDAPARYAAGEEALDLMVRKGHFLSQTLTQIEAFARDQMAEARAFLAVHAADFGAATWQTALAALADLHPSADRYYARYGEVWQACRSAAHARRLVTWPDYPLRYIPQPRWARQAAPFLYFLFYRAPAAFDSLPVVDCLVTPIEADMPPAQQERLLRATNDSVIKLNHVVHHGSIGHQVQNWHAYRAASRIGQVAAVDCASRIAMFSGGTMAEGWATYATDLMDEIGFLTPLESFSQHQSRLRQAARAVVDVNLHRGVFTLEQAATFYREQAGMSAEAAQGEAVKNSMFPGAALMYLMGNQTIHDLRRELAGSDLCAFHDEFLAYGSVPVALIGKMMREERAAKTSGRPPQGEDA